MNIKLIRQKALNLRCRRCNGQGIFTEIGVLSAFDHIDCNQCKGTGIIEERLDWFFNEIKDVK